MSKIYEGGFQAEGKKFALVVSRFNDFITEKLVGGAMDALLRCGCSEADIDIVKVPGAFEIPLAAKKVIARGAYDGLICLGAVIRGATPHFDYVSAEVSKGIAQVSLEADILRIGYNLPVDAMVRLEIFNVRGQRIVTLVNEFQQAGFKTVFWDGKDNRNAAVSSGIYFCRFEAGGHTSTRKMVLLR